MRTAALTFISLIVFSGPVAAQTTAWADKLFTQDGGTTKHDFGTVPRGTQLKYSFKMKNIYKVPLEITNIRPSCGLCASATSSVRVIAPNETAELHVNMDGTRFHGYKSIVIYVTVGPEFISTATLTVTATTRLDVTFNPGEIDFGLVQHGQSPTRTIDVEYAGGQNWQVTEIVKNKSAPFDLKVEELRGRGTKGYRLFATIKANASAGPFKQEVILKTNDQTSPVLTFNVLGNVLANLQVVPSAVNLGGVKVGQTESKKVIVSGSRPFKILAIDGQGDGVTVEVPTVEAARHILEVRFEPGKAGDLKKQLLIRTDLDKESVTVTVEASGTP